MSGKALRFGATVALLVGALGASHSFETRRPQPLERPLESIDREIGGWSMATDVPLSKETLAELSPTEYLSRSYFRDNRTLSVFVAFYAQHRAGETMHSPKVCLPASGWEIAQPGSIAVRLEGRDVVVNRYVVQRAGDRALVLYWYQSGDEVIRSEYMGKIMLVRDALLHGQTAGSIVRIVLRDEPGAAETGAAFAAKLIPQVARCFGRR